MKSDIVKTMRTLILKLTIVTVSLTSLAYGGPEDIDRFAKCYKQFTGEEPSPTNTTLVKVKAGTLTGRLACAEILKSGYLYGGSLSSSTKEEGKKILHTFNLLHNSFFSRFPVKTGKDKWIYDYNDRSYYLLKTLFSTKSDGSIEYPFNEIFQDPETYVAKREGTDNGYRVDRLDTGGTAVYNGFFAYPVCGGRNTWAACMGLSLTYQTLDPIILSYSNIDVSSGFLVWKGGGTRVRTVNGVQQFDISGNNVPGNTKTGNEAHNGMLITNSWTFSLDEASSVGEIVGIDEAPIKPLPHIHQRRFDSDDGYFRGYIAPELKQPYPFEIGNIFDNLGAGILFTPNYQQLMGMDDNNVLNQNGVDHVPREWVQGILSDFFCREIPVIRQADAIPHVTSVTNQKAPFRNSVSCMRCHATIDNFSYMARNYKYAKTTVLGDGSASINHFNLPTYPALIGPPVNPDPYFPVRPADGDFRYRDYSGKYHNVKFSSFEADPRGAFREFGKYVATMDDPYICLTSKYFKYLTGISPVFFDPGDPDAPSLSERDKQIQSYLFTLGKNLKATGDLRATLLDIVSSKLYVDPNASTIK